MSPVVTVLIWLLIPAGALPVITAFVLRRYRMIDSQSLRDRWHIALVMAAVGVTTSLLASNRLFGWNWPGEILVIPFGISLLAVDLVSGKWLFDYWSGRFSQRSGGGPETAIEREDRLVGDTRRELQAQADEENGGYA